MQIDDLRAAFRVIGVIGVIVLIGVMGVVWIVGVLGGESVARFGLARKESPLKNPPNPHEHSLPGVIADGVNSQFDFQ